MEKMFGKNEPTAPTMAKNVSRISVRFLAMFFIFLQSRIVPTKGGIVSFIVCIKKIHIELFHLIQLIEWYVVF